MMSSTYVQLPVYSQVTCLNDGDGEDFSGVFGFDAHGILLLEICGYQPPTGDSDSDETGGGGFRLHRVYPRVTV
jgi:hypothetical protein